MRNTRSASVRILLSFLFVVAGGGRAPAAGFSDDSHTTTLTAHVREQFRVTVPSGVAFDVADTRERTLSTPAAVRVDNIVTANEAQVRVLVKAQAGAFTPPVAGADTWEASDVSWSAAAWQNAAGQAGVLSSAAYTPVATSAPNAGSLGTEGLVFSLAPRPAVTQSGNHTLVIVWKVESMDAPANP